MAGNKNSGDKDKSYIPNKVEPLVLDALHHGVILLLEIGYSREYISRRLGISEHRIKEMVAMEKILAAKGGEG